MPVPHSIFEPAAERNEIDEALRPQQKQYWQLEEKVQAEFRIYNARFIHDPYWRTRFLSIQSAHDAYAGKGGHPVWLIVGHLFSLAQVAFVALPVSAVAGWKGFVVAFIVVWLAFLGLQRVSHWLYWWSFDRAYRHGR